MNKNLEEISDGKIYGLHDMVRVACNDCKDCHFCCEDMGDSVLLDPMDVYLLQKHLGVSIESLIEQKIELRLVEGLILPNLKMNETTNCCVFLNEQGRCSIHAFRPSICRLFPLGRIYDEDRLSYFLQSEGCSKENRSKIKVSKWLDTPELKKNQKYLVDWHNFRKQMEEIIQNTADSNMVKTITLFLLNTFFIKPYDVNFDFYDQFYARMEQIMEVLS